VRPIGNSLTALSATQISLVRAHRPESISSTGHSSCDTVTAEYTGSASYVVAANATGTLTLA
jgi:hypothetical protein